METGSQCGHTLKGWGGGGGCGYVSGVGTHRAVFRVVWGESLGLVTLWTVLVHLPQVPMPSGLHSPEQRSFRERQKYFEVEVKQQQMDKPPKRVSLVGEDDLKKMKEEEGMLQSVQGNLAC